MHPTTRRAALGGSLAAALLAAPSGLRAQAAWPSRPIRLVVPFAAGGAADSAARAITPKMGERLGGATFVVENRTGASGSVGGGEVARSAPDGYTLLWDASSHLVNPSLMRGLPFNYATAFAPVSLVVTFPQVIAVKADFPARSLAEFIAAAKARPGAISMGTQGNATAGHLAVLQFMRRAGVEVTHVPYRGGADAARDLAAGTLDAVFITMLSAGPIVDSGRARFLAVSTPRRVALRPDVPTFAEAGLPGIEISEWAALFAPAGTPAPILARLHSETVEALKSPEMQKRLAADGTEAVGNTSAEFTAQIKSELDKWSKVARAANTKAQ